VGAGLPPARFWDVTPRLCIAEMEGASERLKREARAQTGLAWMIATFTRAKKLPSLDALLGDHAEPSQQTAPEQQAFFDALAASWTK
jgi:hypothetical protein